MNPEQQEAIDEILDRAADMTIATVREDGYPQATTVSFVHDGPVLYFGCGAHSQKARNIAGSNKVSVTVDLPYADWREIRGLSLGGRAHPVTDPGELQHVFDAMVAKFPQVAEFANAGEREEIMAVRIDPEVISLLDYRKGFGHTEQIETRSPAARR